MNLVFCMAGLYKRFRDAGYLTPKFLLPFSGRTTLEHVVGEMIASPGGRGAFGTIVFVANERDRASELQLLKALAGLGLDAASIAWTKDTPGQADTALVGLEHLYQVAPNAREQPVLFHNIDTILSGRNFTEIAAALRSADGYIDCVDSDQPQYSYVLADDSGRAIDIREKQVISRHATTGLYGFRSGGDYQRSAETTVHPGKERFISGVYKTMITAGSRVVINMSHAGHKTVIVGTPAEYESLATPDEIRRARTGDTESGCTQRENAQPTVGGRA